MRILLFLSAIAAATCQYYGYHRQPVQYVRPVVHSGGGGGGFGGLGLVDVRYRGSDYHFSWRHDGGQKYTWGDANSYCSYLGRGWQGVSIGDYGEDQFISSIIGKDGVKYIWTGGRRNGYGFSWPTGEPFHGINWSHTGGDGYPQPDNREDGREFCLAILNNFYNDGIKWHDVACHHEKPIICERRSGFYN